MPPVRITKRSVKPPTSVYHPSQLLVAHYLEQVESCQNERNHQADHDYETPELHAQLAAEQRIRAKNLTCISLHMREEQGEKDARLQGDEADKGEVQLPYGRAGLLRLLEQQDRQCHVCTRIEGGDREQRRQERCIPQRNAVGVPQENAGVRSDAEAAYWPSRFCLLPWQGACRTTP